MQREQVSRLAVGAALVTIGAALLAGQFEFSVVGHLQRLWPLGLLIAGIPKLIVGDADGGRSSGVWLTTLGVVFLLHTYRVLSLRHSWPLFLVALGVSMLIENVSTPPGKKKA